MNAPFPVTPASTLWVLRVLSGRLAGAERRLPIGTLLHIGHGFDNDIVLRGTLTPGVSIALDVTNDQARLKVISGEVTLLGRPVVAGDSAILLPYVPFQIGEFAVAIGGDAEDRWDEAQRASLSLATAVEPHSHDVPRRANLAARMTTRLYPVSNHFVQHKGSMWLLIMLGLLLIGFAAVAPVTDAIRGQIYSPAAVQNMLATTGFGALKVTRDSASQTVIVSGMVASDKDAARLRALVADKYPGALLDITTPASLASAVTDILRNNKIDAEARAGRGGAIVVVSEYLPIDRQTELTALLKRDLPALKTVEYQLDNRRGDRDLQYFFSASNSGLATYVDGNPGYLVTQDQSRWFVGSTVPTGHKILSIGGGRVIFERQGLIEELVM